MKLLTNIFLRSALTLVFALSALSLAAEMRDALVVSYNNGDPEEAFFLDEAPRVTYDKTVLHISTGSADISRDLPTVRRFVIEQRNLSSAATNLDAVAFVYLDNSILSLSGLRASTPCTLSGIDGKVALRGSADAQGVFRADISTLPAGVYILSTPDSKSYKIFKK